MSGGTFNHDDYHISRIANEIEDIIVKNDSTEKDEYGYEVGHHYSAETLKKFQRAVDLLCVASVFVHRIDWLLAGDDGEDTFHERLEHDLKKLEQWEKISEAK